MRVVLKEAVRRTEFTWGYFLHGERPPKLRAGLAAGASLTFVTMGIKYMLDIAQYAKHEKLRRSDTPNCFEVDRCFKEQAFVQHAVLKRALVEADVFDRQDLVWVFNTRMFHDPGEDRVLLNHVGSNGSIVARMVEHRRFPQFLDSLYFAWQQIMLCMKKGTKVRIVLFCKSGRHRSVAAALLAAHLFEATEGMPAPAGTVHLCASWWSQLCPRNCPECTRQSEVRDMALHTARKMWQEVIERKKN